MKPTRSINFSNLFLEKKLYMFRTVPLSIIRSFSLYTQQWYMSYRFADSLRAGSGYYFYEICSINTKNETLSSINTLKIKLIKIIKSIVFSLLFVIFIILELVLLCWLFEKFSYWSCSQAVSKTVWHIPLLCVQWKTPDDGQRNCPKHLAFLSR